VGTISLSTRREHSWFFATVTGFTTPGTIQKYDFKGNADKRWTVYRTTKVKALVLEDFVAEQVGIAYS
jgi:prolyl oligopeptidase